MKLHRSVLTAVALVGAFVLAGIGAVDGDAAIGFVAGALAVPSAAQLTRG